eukprot:s81_g14.t1
MRFLGCLGIHIGVGPKLPQDWRAIFFVEDASREAHLSAVSGCWKALEVVAPSEDSELALVAVSQSAEALRFVSPRLRDDYEFMAKAVKVDGRSLHYASSRLQADRTLLLEASKLSSWAIDCAPQALREDEDFKQEVLAVNPLARRFFGGYEAADSSESALQEASRQPQHQDIIGRWRYQDDVESDSSDDDFVVEFWEAEAALAVRFLLADAMTSAQCSATLEGRRLRIEEREGETLNIYEAMIGEVPTVIQGRFWCQSSGEGNSFQEGACGHFSLHRLEKMPTDLADPHCLGPVLMFLRRKG